MPRMMRIQYPEVLYHVINRGNYKSDIFASDGARNAFLKALGEAVRRHEWKLHAYIIMRNHYHLALDLNE
jgi:REP element-mobilizing transposase RayT